MLTAEAEFGRNAAELLLTWSVLDDANDLLQSSYASFQSDIQTPIDLKQPTDFRDVQRALAGTLTSLDIGAAATQAISDVAGLNKTALDDVWEFAGNIGKSILGKILGALSPIASAVVAPINAALGSAVTAAMDVDTFVTNLKGYVTAAKTAVLTSSPFSTRAIADDTTHLAGSVAETQGQIFSTTPTPRLSLSAKASSPITVDHSIALNSLFTPSITPSGTGDAVDHYTLTNLSPGSGYFIINSVVHTEAQVSNVTMAMFKTAYFASSKVGTDQVRVTVFDTAGNNSTAGTTIAVSAATTTPPPSTASNLQVTSANLVNSSPVAGGGGLLSFSVKNLGTSAAPSTALSKIYLSTNTTLDSSDIVVSSGAITDAGLAAGATQGEELPFTLPNNIAGSYYLIVFAGDDAQVTNGGAAGKTNAIPIFVTANSTAPQPPATNSTQPSGANPISIVTNAPITTRVSSEPGIRSTSLRTTDSQYPNDTSLRYTIVTPPAHGQLINDFFIASTFTQADIDNALVSYIQDGTSVSSDSFSFYVSDPAGYNSSVQTFNITILPSITPPPPVIPNVTLYLANDTGIPTFGGAPAFYTSDVTLAGSANPGATVVLTDGSTSLGSAIADANGNWTFSPTLAQGGHNISASVTISGQTAANFL